MANRIGVVATEGSVDGLSTALKFIVGGSNPGVDDVGIGVGTSVGIVDVAGRSTRAVRDRTESPGGAALSSQGTLCESLCLFFLLLNPVDDPLAVRFDDSNLDWISALDSSWTFSVTYIRVLLDLLDGALVERASITLEAILALVGALNTILGALVQSTLVNILNPAEMAVDIGSSDIRLESDDVLARNDLAGVNLGSSRGGVDEPEEGSRGESEVFVVHHCEDAKEQRQNKRRLGMLVCE